MARRRHPVLSIPLPQDARALALLLGKLDSIYRRPEVAIEEEGTTLVVTATGTIDDLLPVDAEILGQQLHAIEDPHALSDVQG